MCCTVCLLFTPFSFAKKKLVLCLYQLNVTFLFSSLSVCILFYQGKFTYYLIINAHDKVIVVVKPPVFCKRSQQVYLHHLKSPTVNMQKWNCSLISTLHRHWSWAVSAPSEDGNAVSTFHMLGFTKGYSGTAKLWFWHSSWGCVSSPWSDWRLVKPNRMWQV